MFLFFKQKTAYEMRISDWSSDVCSSDLIGAFIAVIATCGMIAPPLNVPAMSISDGVNMPYAGFGMPLLVLSLPPAAFVVALSALRLRGRARPVPTEAVGAAPAMAARFSPSEPRSEEHTTELQSLMRISSAVFCLKKKNNNLRKL